MRILRDEEVMASREKLEPLSRKVCFGSVETSYFAICHE